MKLFDAYLAVPYTDPDPLVREYRAWCANERAAELLRRGEMVLSPIAHSHGLALQCGLPKDIEFWWPWNKRGIKASICLEVLVLDGWEDSVGVRREVAYARDTGRDVRHQE